MTEKVSTGRGGPGWKKGLGIAGLAAVLAVVAGQEFLASRSPAPADKGPLTRADGLALPAAASPDRPKRTPLALALPEVVANDPFQLPKAIQEQLDALARHEEEQTQEPSPPQEDAQQSLRQQTLDRLKQEGVQMIVETSNGRAALVGGRVIREGDRIDGFVVVRITQDGIELTGDQPKQ